MGSLSENLIQGMRSALHQGIPNIVLLFDEMFHSCPSTASTSNQQPYLKASPQPRQHACSGVSDANQMLLHRSDLAHLKAINRVTVANRKVA